MRKVPLFLLPLGFAFSLQAQTADVAVTKSGPATITAGGPNATYTITVTNNGPNSASVTLNDSPSQSANAPLFFVSWTQNSGPTVTCATPSPGNSGTIDCIATTFGSSQSASFTLVESLPAAVLAGNSVPNSATAFVNAATDPVPGNNTATVTSTSIASADLVAAKALFGGGPLVAGAKATYTLTVTNSGPSDAQSVTLTDVLPPHTTFFSLAQNGGSPFLCTTPAVGSNGTITCTRGTFAIGDGPAVFNLTVNVTPDAPNGSSINNTATVSSATSDPNGANNSQTDSHTVSATTDISVHKLATSGAVAGTNVTYSITVADNQAGCGTGCPADALNAVLTDALPTNTTFVSLTQNNGPTFNCTTPAVGAGGTVSCTIADLPNSSSANFTLVLHVRPNAGVNPGSTVDNTATVSNSNPDGNTSNNSDTASTTAGTIADVGVLKTGPATAQVNSNISYDITVNNSGPSDTRSGSLSVSDVVPTGTTFVSFTQNTGPTFSCTTPGVGATGTVTCVTPTMAVGTSANFTFIVQATAALLPGATVTNTATATSTPMGIDPNPGNDSSSVTTTIVGSADLAVTKSGPATVTPGMTATYTVNLTNNGPSGAQTVSLTDNVPVGMTFVSVTQTAGPTFACTTPAVGGTGPINCTIANFASAATATFSIVFNVISSDANGMSISNTATVTSATSDPTPGNNSSTATSTASTLADLAVTKSGPATFSSGNNITYNLTVSNTGPSDAANVSMTDPLPVGATFVSELQTSGPAFTCTNPAVGSGGTVNCMISTLAAGASAGFSITIHTPPSLASGATMTNTASVSSATTDPNPTNNSATTNATAAATADVSITKTGPPAAAAGGTLSYTVVVTNNGTSDAQNVVMTDAVPANTTFVSETQNSGPVAACTNPPAGGTGTVSCSFTTLAAGSSGSFTIVVRASSSAMSGSTITNTANVSSTTADSNTANNSASSTATVATTVADVAVTKSGSPPSVTGGANITYTVTVTNNGPSDALTASMSDAVPANTTFVSETQTAGPAFSCSTPPGGGTGTTTCTIGTLVNGASATFSIAVKVNSGAPAGTITNTATVTTATADSNAAYDSASATTTVSSNQADLSVTKSGPATIAPGAAITYTITVMNNGSADAQNVALSDVIPTNTTFVSLSQTSGPAFTCTSPAVGATGTVSCNILTFINGAAATFTLQVAVNASASGTISNTANVTSATMDPNAANNSATATTTVTSAPPTNADVSITKSAGSTVVGPGGNVTYTITVTNAGPAAASSVAVTDNIPAGTTFVSATPSQGTCSGTSTVTCGLGTIANGATATITLTITAPAAPGTFTNTATVSSSNDTNATNNTSSSMVTVSSGIPALSPEMLALLALVLAALGVLAVKV